MNDTGDIEQSFARIENINKKGSFSELPMNPKELMTPTNFIPASQVSPSILVSNM